MVLFIVNLALAANLPFPSSIHSQCAQVQNLKEIPMAGQTSQNPYIEQVLQPCHLHSHNSNCDCSQIRQLSALLIDVGWDSLLLSPSQRFCDYLKGQQVDLCRCQQPRKHFFLSSTCFDQDALLLRSKRSDFFDLMLSLIFTIECPIHYLLQAGQILCHPYLFYQHKDSLIALQYVQIKTFCALFYPIKKNSNFNFYLF
ncbi:hypothetical protein FGO68_gene10520 [Halteria grandinella]|uniref:Uncharacterized protein n=1 Tax=Halteria grandinella TaxID=5974 RepID=A0A8J8P5M5_HALGN|nr:hypothetical protein FGO68_gene10520 [Halteria grandinella]